VGRRCVSSADAQHGPRGVALVAGELLVHFDKTRSDSEAREPPREAGGAAFEVARHLAARGWGVRVAGLVGDDEAGAWLRRAIAEAGLDAGALVPRVGVATGTLRIEPGPRYLPTRDLEAEASAPAPRVDGARRVHLASVLPHEAYFDGAHALAAEAHDTGARVSLDLNARRGLFRGCARGAWRDAVLALAARVDLVKASEDDLAVLALDDDALLGALAPHARLVVTRSEHGATVLDREGRLDRPAPARVDGPGLGAGDALVAALIDGDDAGLDRSEFTALVDGAQAYASAWLARHDAGA
jgi:sugar/nucleoside kinase (ribokinase family)